MHRTASRTRAFVARTSSPDKTTGRNVLEPRARPTNKSRRSYFFFEVFFVVFLEDFLAAFFAMALNHLLSGSLNLRVVKNGVNDFL